LRRVGGARAALAAVLVIGFSLGAGAQAPPFSDFAPHSPSRPAVAPDPLRAAFEALGEAERRAVQEALIWTGDYKGGLDGVFGRGARDGLLAYAGRARIAPESVLGPGRANLLAAGAQRREGVGFRQIVEARSGASIGLPTGVLRRRTDASSGARFANSAGSAFAETFALREAAADLPALFERLRAQTGGRRVTYRILRGNFLVVAGEDSRGLFYTRAARGEVDGRPVVRGFTLVYARGLEPAFEPIVIAMSAAFEPFPAPVSEPQASDAPVVHAAPAGRVAGSALLVEPGRALASLARACEEPQVGGRPARVLRRDAATGLALLAFEGSAGGPPPARLAQTAPPEPGAIVYALFANRDPEGHASVSLAPGRVLSPATPGGGYRIAAAIFDGVGGAAVFDASARLVGVVTQPADEPRRVAGVAPQAAHPFVNGSDVARFLGEGGAAGTPLAALKDEGAAGVAATFAASLAPLTCR
jgi:hypothetical protein